MKIKIAKDKDEIYSELYIERKGKLLQQHCLAIENRICGDWCPAFGEPANGELETCKRIIEYDELIDERK